MQKKEQLDIMCPKHGEKIISVKKGELQMSCLKCFTENEVTIEELTQQLTDLRQKKINYLIEFGIQSEKRLVSLKKVLQLVKENIDQQIDNILKIINDEIIHINHSVQKEVDLLYQPIQQWNITQVINNIRELRQQQEIKNDQRIIEAEKLKNSVIKQHEELSKSIDLLIKQESNCERQKEIIKDQETVNKKSKILIREQFFIKKYKSNYKHKGIKCSYAIAMDKDEKILVSGQSNNILILDFNSDGIMKLKYTLIGHTGCINSLCFSKKEYWFISGSDDKSIRIWRRKDNNEEWILEQVLCEAHQDWVLGIVLNNNEDQFISCSRDKSIKVWIKFNGWHTIQTLEGHDGCSRFLSFNHNCSLLASTGDDGIKIWKNDKFWKLKQVIKKPSEDYYLRIKFIHKKELIVSTQYLGIIQRFTLNNEGIFQFSSQIELNNGFDSEYLYFPIIYNEQLQLAIVQHCKQVYVLKYDNGQFIIHQIFKGEHRAGYLLKDGNYLILSDFQNDILEIYN